MKLRMMTAAWVVILLVRICNTSELDAYLQSELDQMPATALATGIVDADGLAWSGYYGTIDGSRPTTGESLFMMASVSKLVIAAAVMQLWEAGQFALDDDISDYLPFEVRNPSYTNTAITFRHLLTHRSSLADSDVYYDLYTIDDGGGDSPWALGEFLQAYLVPGGELYSGDSYLASAPGQRFEYSNTGAALLAYLVEVMAEQDYADYCHDHLFAPLGMTHTYYKLDDIPASETELVTCFDGDEPLPHYSYPDYPAGALRTTISDMARFAAFFIDPAGNEAAILQPGTVTLMFGACDADDRRCDAEDMALIWAMMDWMVPGAIGHTGGDFGVATSLILYPSEGFGTLLFMNEEPGSDATEQEINTRLHEEAPELVHH